MGGMFSSFSKSSSKDEDDEDDEDVYGLDRKRCLTNCKKKCGSFSIEDNQPLIKLSDSSGGGKKRKSAFRKSFTKTKGTKTKGTKGKATRKRFK